MSIFNSAVLTRRGNELLVTAAAGKQIIFTRLVTGCGIYSEEEKQRSKLEQATALKDQKQEFPFSKYEKASETSVLLTAIVSNLELTEGYKITEIGVYGKEVGAEEDFLCSIAVTRSLEETDSFPPYNGLRECQIIQDYYITISPDAEVVVNTQGAAALAIDLETLRLEMQKIPRIRFGAKNTELNNNEVLFVTGEEETAETFKVARISNIVVSNEEPTEGENWGAVEGDLTVGNEPKEDTTFFAQI